MKPSIFAVKGYAVEIVDDGAIIEIFGPNIYSDIKRELVDASGIMVIKILEHEKKMFSLRYKDTEVTNNDFMILGHVKYLGKLTDNEVMACVMHEIGHICTYEEDDNACSQDNEIKADNYAISQGVDPLDILSSFETLIKVNLEIKYPVSYKDKYTMLANTVYKHRLNNLLSYV